MKNMTRKGRKKIAYVGLVLIIGMVLAIIIGCINMPEKQEEEYTFYHSYKVQAGDTIDGISHIVDKYNTNLNFKETKEYICELNQIHPDRITAGNHIVVPYTDDKLLEVLGN